MNLKNVYLKPFHLYAYSSYECPLITGVVSVTPEGLDPRVCYKVEYIDEMKVDYIPISEVQNGNYEIIYEDE